MSHIGFITLLSFLRILAAPPAAPATAPKASVPAAKTPADATRLPLKDVILQVQKRYDAAADFRAQFSQTLTNAAFNRKTISSGEVLFKKPGRMRWNYEKPEPKLYVTDGTLLWLYEPEDKQAFKQDLKGSQLPAALAFLTGRGKLADEFEISFSKDTSRGTARDYVLDLKPRQAQAQYKSILFIIDPVTFYVRESILVDAQGNTNDLTFTNIKVNSGIPDGTFKWTPPAGVRVIDTAKLAKP